MKRLKVSVIIPAYNAMPYIADSLQSVLNQSFADFEVLIINDGSSDNIEEWVSTVSDPRVKFISQENQGVSAARNKGILHSRGTYIAFLDADDLWEPTKLEKQVNYLDNNPELGAVDTFIFLIDSQGKLIFPIGSFYQQGNKWKDFIEWRDAVLCGSTLMVRRSCFEAVGLFDQELAALEDSHMWIRIAACYDFAILQEPLASYRQHINSASKNHEWMMSNSIRSIEKIYEFVPLELQHLKWKAYGRVIRSIAGGAYGSGDYNLAVRYYFRALYYYPQLCFTGGIIRPLIKSIIYASLGALK
jgi:glycosyltransferase involved in cell wall biosynthesis